MNVGMWLILCVMYWRPVLILSQASHVHVPPAIKAMDLLVEPVVMILTSVLKICHELQQIVTQMQFAKTSLVDTSVHVTLVTLETATSMVLGAKISMNAC